MELVTDTRRSPTDDYSGRGDWPAKDAEGFALQTDLAPPNGLSTSCPACTHRITIRITTLNKVRTQHAICVADTFSHFQNLSVTITIFVIILCHYLQ